jgi:uncharacterized membrane protein
MQQRNVAYSMLETLRAVLQFVLPVVTMVLLHGSSFLVVSLSSSLGALIAALAACTIAFRGIVIGAARFTYRELFAIGVPMIVLAIVGLAATVVVTERLTPVPVPWRDIGVSVVIAAASGVAAALGAAAMGDGAAIIRLVAGGLAGGAVFLGGNSLIYPEATRQLARKLAGRLGMA